MGSVNMADVFPVGKKMTLISHGEIVWWDSNFYNLYW